MCIRDRVSVILEYFDPASNAWARITDPIELEKLSVYSSVLPDRLITPSNLVKLDSETIDPSNAIVSKGGLMFGCKYEPEASSTYKMANLQTGNYVKYFDNSISHGFSEDCQSVLGTRIFSLSDKSNISNGAWALPITSIVPKQTNTLAGKSYPDSFNLTKPFSDDYPTFSGSLFTSGQNAKLIVYQPCNNSDMHYQDYNCLLYTSPSPRDS